MDFMKRNGVAILTGLALGIVGAWLIRRGHDQLDRGRVISGSQFRRPRFQIAQFHLYLVLAGISFGAVLALGRSKPPPWRLIGGAMAPVVVPAVAWDRLAWTWLPSSIHRRFLWAGVEVEAAAAVIVGVLLSAALIPVLRGRA